MISHPWSCSPTRRHILLSITGLALLLSGCGSGEPLPELGDVSGTVTLDGKPLPNARVVFEPENGRASEGRTDENGHYELLYNADATGAVIGPHTVRVTNDFQEVDKDGNIMPSENTLPPRFNTQSNMVKNVEAGENIIDLPLSTK